MNAPDPQATLEADVRQAGSVPAAEVVRVPLDVVAEPEPEAGL